MTETVRKRCARCGAVERAKPRERRCKAKRFGKGSYCCWGDLVAVRRKPVVPLDQKLGVGQVLTAAQFAERAAAHHGAAYRMRMAMGRIKAEHRLHDAEAAAKLAARALAAAQRRVGKWGKARDRYAAREAYTDAQVAEVRGRTAKAHQVQAVRRRLAKAAKLA